MKSITNEMIRFWCGLLMVLALTACHDDDEQSQAPMERSRPSVTLLTSINGVGDNGYNDCILNGLFKFYEQTGVVAQLHSPTNMADAEHFYREWLASNANTDSVVLILGSSAYEQMARQVPTGLKGKGSRVLLLESSATIDGVNTVAIDRYGACYLAGVLLGSSPSYILAAAPGFPEIERAIAGYKDGHAAHQTTEHPVAVDYLANGEEGFAMPDSAYHVMKQRIISQTSDTLSSLVYVETVLPLLGGSGTGAMKAMSDYEINGGLMVGMDTDRSGQSPCIPFSVVIHIDNILFDYLTEWRNGKPWATTQTKGLEEQATEIKFTPNYVFSTLAEFYNKDYSTTLFTQKAEQYREEAIAKEKSTRQAQ